MKHASRLAALALIALALFAAFNSFAAEVGEAIDPVAPYFQDDKGRISAIKQPVSANKDRAWLGLRFPEAPGAKVPVAVRVEGDVAGVYTAGVASMLENSLVSAGRFRLFDSKSASSNSSKGPKYTITAQVVEYNPHKKGRGIGGLGAGLIGGATGGLIGGVDVNTSSAEVAISVRLIDSRSGELLKNTILRGASGNTSFGVSGIGIGGAAAAGVGVSSWANGAIAAAAQIAVNKASHAVYQWLVGEQSSAASAPGR